MKNKTKEKIIQITVNGASQIICLTNKSRVIIQEKIQADYENELGIRPMVFTGKWFAIEPLKKLK